MLQRKKKVDKEDREDFWNSVRDVLHYCKKNERIVLLGDFNGWVGVKRDGYESVLGPFGIKGRENENGNNVLEICLEKNLCVTNTLFKHKEIHMFTWENHKMKSMIDFVIVDETEKMCGRYQIISWSGDKYRPLLSYM